jgi:hypothetical protein
VSEKARDLVAVNPEELEARDLRTAARVVAKLGSSARTFQALVESEAALNAAAVDIQRLSAMARLADRFRTLLIEAQGEFSDVHPLHAKIEEALAAHRESAT